MGQRKASDWGSNAAHHRGLGGTRTQADKGRLDRDMDTDRAPNRITRGTTGLVVLVAACGLIAALAAPTLATAAKGTPKQGLTTGFQDGFVYQSSDAATRARWLDRTTDAGGGIVRLVAIWPSIVGDSRPADASN